MLDQSQSINGSDPTGARLFSAKAFLDGLGPEDHVLLSAFANDSTTDALIPTKPLTIYPPFRDATTVDDAPSYDDTLDSLADLVGGGTPLYESLDQLRRGEWSTTRHYRQASRRLSSSSRMAKTPIAAARTHAVRRRDAESIAAGRTADNVRVFTIGLSAGIDFEALADLANKTGGAFLFANSAEQLIPLYGTVGELLSLSLPTYRLSFSVDCR